MAINLKRGRYESDLRRSLERGEWRSIAAREEETERSMAAAREQIAATRKEARVSLRLNATDVDKMREKATEAGLPYQTLIASVIHLFASNQLVERKVVEELKDVIRKEKKAV